MKSVCVVLLFFAAAVVAGQAQTLITLAFLNGTDGDGIYSPLVQGVDGNFYGAAQYGGSDSLGVVFKITPEGTLTTLHNFHGPDGGNPNWIIQATDGNLYGTTLDGETSQGTVFKITLAGTLTTLATFNGPNGSLPNGLVEGTDGNFYGTTLYSGNLTCNPPYGCGTVFRVTPQGVLTKLHSFDGTDGVEPYAVPIQGADGNFYGTTRSGGSNHDGTVFKITPQGVFTTLKNFDGTDGSVVITGLVQAVDGTFYGTTDSGGSFYDTRAGTIFQMTPDGTLTTLMILPAPLANASALIQATDGNLYGASDSSVNSGILFELTPEGTITILHSFDGVDGGDPRSALTQGTDGNLYGTTLGSVFRLSVGLAPFVETLTKSGMIGAPVIILGNDLTGATGVAFNGVAAAFTVISATEITATVPTGASTGLVQVTTPDNDLTSNMPFQVTP